MNIFGQIIKKLSNEQLQKYQKELNVNKKNDWEQIDKSATAKTRIFNILQEEKAIKEELQKRKNK